MNDNILENEKQTLKLYDSQTTSNYRKYDEEFITTPTYKHIAAIITKLSKSFDRSISALDVGCGTGRYFHCLKNLKALTGIDLSPNMLQEAKKPFSSSEILVDEIKLIEGNFYNYNFGGEKFDLIYSVGVLGEHAPFDYYTCNKLHELLHDRGKLFFTVVDIEPRKNIKRKVAEACYPLFPGMLKNIFDKRWATNYLTLEQLNSIMRNASFSEYEIQRHVSKDPLWQGVHLECIATK